MTEQKLKPFDYEAYERGEKAITRCGYPVLEILRFKDKRLIRPLVVIVDVHGALKEIHCSLEGVQGIGANPSDWDLFMAPVKKKGYINLYNNTAYPMGVQTGSGVFQTIEEAESMAGVLSTLKPYL